MTVKDVLNHLKIGRTNLYDLLKKGKIQTVKIGKRTLFDPEDLKKFIEGQKIMIKAKPRTKASKPKKAPSK